MLLIIQNNCNCDEFIWLWPLVLAFLLGLILGWLLKQIFGKDNSYSDKIKKLETQLNECRNNLKTKNEAQPIEKEAITSTNVKTETQQIVASKTEIQKDNLTKVEGIGPKIQGLLYDAEIYTWQKLSETATETLEKILADAGPRYKMHKPKTWAKQAKLAAKGEWEKLKKWQNELKGGL